MSTPLSDSQVPDAGENLPAYYATHPAEAERDANALIHSYLNENLTVVRRGTIAHPVCIPQMEVGFDMPFARAYPPGLAELGISQEVFLDFIDGLNTAMIASPPLQVVDFAGLVIGFVTSSPHETFFLIGLGLQAGAQIGIRVIAKTLTDRFMRAANERIFAPAGLRVRICKSPAMRALAKVPWVEAPPPSKLKKLAEYMSTVGLWMPPSPPPGHVPVDPRISDPLMRRLAPYEGYYLPMTRDVPPPRSSPNVVNKLSDFAVNFRRNSLTKRAENANARRQILAGVPLSRELTRKDKKVLKKIAKGKGHKIGRKVYKDDRREARANENILWLVIVNEDEDHLIQGTERVDDARDEVVFNEAEIEQAQREFEEELAENDDSSSSSVEDGEYSDVKSSVSTKAETF
ncbi:hypothetical protein SCHPADRAFT_885332 [Schizopora paradoxa]|uniref:Uncharacterized protein n=1 Tax=Schizopora paradoxa TaxID=27342 RepID=A0A0H2S5F1_9AGAM|nr:hypothetical protein SCHPADRAFT_885332 [Schizopora paradoxa]